MNIDKETNSKIDELRVLEQHSQNFLAQKQNSQLELSEIENAIKELSKAEDETYKIVGGIMIKFPKEKLLKELEERKKIVELRILSFEKQERLVEKKVEELQKEINEKLFKSRKKETENIS